MVDYPLEFGSESRAQNQQTVWKTKSEDYQIEISIPEEFGGDSEKPSPEVLYTMAIENCLLATFKTVAERNNLDYSEIKSDCKAVLERNKDGRPEITSARVKIQVSEVEDKEKAQEVKGATLKNCFIHRSVETDIQSEFEFQ